MHRVSPILKDTIQNIIKTNKNNKSPINDRIEAELLMSGGQISRHDCIGLFNS